jgi:hypothetical protein
MSAFLSSCANCGRAANADSTATLSLAPPSVSLPTLAPVVFCSENCYWSHALDTAGTRHRGPKRAPPRAQRRIRTRTRAPTIASDDKPTDRTDDVQSAVGDDGGAIWGRAGSDVDEVFFPTGRAGRAALALYAFCPSGVV